MATVPCFVGGISMENLLPLLDDRPEAESLLTMIMVGHEVDAAVRGLVSSLKHTRLLECYYVSVVRMESPFYLTLAPVLYHAITRSIERVLEQKIQLSNLITSLAQINSIVQRYGVQNMELAVQQQDTHPEVADRKHYLASLEAQISKRASQILEAATKKITPGDCEDILCFGNPTAPYTEAARGSLVQEEATVSDGNRKRKATEDADLTRQYLYLQNEKHTVSNTEAARKKYAPAASSRWSSSPYNNNDNSQNSDPQNPDSQNEISQGKEESPSNSYNGVEASGSSALSAPSPEIDITSTA